jgi:hypothetical protein
MDFLTPQEKGLFYDVMSTCHNILGITKIQSLRDETNPNAETYIINADPQNVDITLEVIKRTNDKTTINITQNSDVHESNQHITLPTATLRDNETIRTLRDMIRSQYKRNAMATILKNALPDYSVYSVEESKNYRGNTNFVYTFWGRDNNKEPIRFVMSETLLDTPPVGGHLHYQEFNTFSKNWKTKTSYISEALFSTKERVEGNETIVGVPELYGDWSLTNFIKNNVTQKTLEQEIIMAPLHQLTNLDPEMYGGVNMIVNRRDKFGLINRNYNLAYKIPDIEENRICDVDVYIYPTTEHLTEPNEQTKRFIMRYQHPTDQEPGYFNVYEPTATEPKLIARKEHTSESLDDMLLLTNHLKKIAKPSIEKQVEQKKQLSRFSLNHHVAHEENEDLEP